MNIFFQTIHCAPNMNHGQCFPDKTILTVTFASMETRHEPTLLSIKFYTIDERMEEAMSRGKCWRGWKKFGGHCYYFSTESKNWTNAEVGLTFNLTCIMMVTLTYLLLGLCSIICSDQVFF